MQETTTLKELGVSRLLVDRDGTVRFMWHNKEVIFCSRCASLKQAIGYAGKQLKRHHRSHVVRYVNGQVSMATSLKKIVLACTCETAELPDWKKKLIAIKRELGRKRK